MSEGDLSGALRARPRLAPALMFAAAAAMLAGAWGFQLIGGLQPCPLCLYQRWPYWIVVAIAGLATLAAPRLSARGLGAVAAVCGLVFASGAAIAGFHVGVEQGWWEGLQSCGGGDLNDPSLSIEELKARLLATPVVRCDDVPWSLFGISLAGFNFLAAAVLAVLSLCAARAISRRTA